VYALSKLLSAKDFLLSFSMKKPNNVIVVV